MKIEKLFDLSHTVFSRFLRNFSYPWEILDYISKYIEIISGELGEGYEEREPGVFVHRTARVVPSACLKAPCVIGAYAEVRHCAFVRGSVLVGEGAVVGNSTELKNCILFDGVQAPHFNYVGDSILGYRAHLGAGAITSNVKGDRSPVTVRCGDVRVATGRIKCGAFLGDGAEIGCNTVLNPGCVLGKGVRAYPLLSLRGAYPAHSLIKK